MCCNVAAEGAPCSAMPAVDGTASTARGRTNSAPGEEASCRGVVAGRDRGGGVTGEDERGDCGRGCVRGSTIGSAWCPDAGRTVRAGVCGGPTCPAGCPDGCANCESVVAAAGRGVDRVTSPDSGW